MLWNYGIAVAECTEFRKNCKFPTSQCSIAYITSKKLHSKSYAVSKKYVDIFREAAKRPFPPPVLVVGPLKKKTFFAASLTEHNISVFC